MKCILALACLALVACVVAADDPAVAVIAEISALKEANDKLTDHLKAFLDGDKNSVSSASKDKLKDLGGSLGDSEARLSEQMAKLGEFLGLPKLPPPPPVPQADIY